MGMVRQWQELLHGSRYSESYMEGLPDFVKLAESFGLKGLRATHPGELDGVIQEMLDADCGVIVDVAVAPEENCFPMIPSGAAHNEMIFGADVKTEGAIAEDGMVLV
jgi:acetolactate synthase-1/2/3 large subunit